MQELWKFRGLLMKNFTFAKMHFLLLLVSVFMLSCSEQQEKPEIIQENMKTIGLIVAGSDVCYDAAASVFENQAKLKGWTVLRYSSDYKKELEMLNDEDCIAKKVDAIAMITTDIQTAGEATRKCREAGVPIFFFMTMPQFPEGIQATAIVTTDWYMTGYLNGEYISNNYPTARCVLIEGGYDQGMTELMRQGFVEGLAANKNSTAEVVANVTGSWMKPNAIVAMNDLLEQKENFDCIFTGNEEMMLGVIDVLQEKNLLEKYHLFSENGREDVSGKFIPAGVIEASAEASTTQEGDLVFQLMEAYFAGKAVPYHIYSPVRLLTKENISSAVPWSTEEYLSRKQAGELVRDYTKMQVVEKPRYWSKEGNNYASVHFYK